MSRSSDPIKPAVWRERFERFFDSGLAVAPFCAREGVSVASFYLWRKKLGVHGRAAPRPLFRRPGRRRRMTGGYLQHRGSPTNERGAFQQVALVPTRPASIGSAPTVVSAGRGFIPVAPGLVLPARAVSIQLPCGTRIEVDAADLDAVRVAIAEVLRADRGVTTMQADADRDREAGTA